MLFSDYVVVVAWQVALVGCFRCGFGGLPSWFAGLPFVLVLCGFGMFGWFWLVLVDVSCVVVFDCCRVLLRLEGVGFGWVVVLITLFWVLFW